MNIVMLGVQGCGKGTQSKLLAKRFGLPHVSTGDLFRANIAQDTELGRKARAYTDAGELVPDEIVIDMARDRLAQPDAAGGYILDGFPRSAAQVEALDEFSTVQHAVLLELPDEIAVNRLASRAECSDCGIIYGANRKPKTAGVCDECGKPLKLRSDDADVEAVRRRVAIFHKEIDVLLNHYETMGVLRRVNAEGTVEDIHERIVAAVGR